MTLRAKNHQPCSRNGNAAFDIGSDFAADEDVSSRRTPQGSTSRRYLSDCMLTYEKERKADETLDLSARGSALSLVGLDRELRFGTPDGGPRHRFPNLLQPLDSSLSIHSMSDRRRNIAINMSLSTEAVDIELSAKHDHREKSAESTRRLPSNRRAHDEHDGSDENEDESHADDDEGNDGAQDDSDDEAGNDGESTAALESNETNGTESNTAAESNKDIPAPTNDSHAPSNGNKGIPSPPMNSDTTGGSQVKSACGGTICQTGLIVSNHIILSSLAAVTLALLCYWRLRICCSRRRVDHGEYRMVTAQYVDSAFDDSLSDAGDDEGSDDENFDGGWSKAGKRSIEMHAIDREMNGGLTLEEING
jgi:hypothetical protein